MSTPEECAMVGALAEIASIALRRLAEALGTAGNRDVEVLAMRDRIDKIRSDFARDDSCPMCGAEKWPDSRRD